MTNRSWPGRAFYKYRGHVCIILCIILLNFTLFARVRNDSTPLTHHHSSLITHTAAPLLVLDTTQPGMLAYSNRTCCHYPIFSDTLTHPKIAAARCTKRVLRTASAPPTSTVTYSGGRYRNPNYYEIIKFHMIPGQSTGLAGTTTLQ